MQEVIPLTLVDLEGQKLTDITYASLDLTDKGIIYSVRFHADEPIDKDDFLSGWNNIFNCFTVFCKKSSIVGIQKRFSENNKNWVVEIILN